MSFKQIVGDIKSLKIQGATNVATSAVLAIKELIKEKKSDSTIELAKSLKKGKLLLFKSRPTEPMMRNAINFVLQDIDNLIHEPKVLFVSSIHDKIHEAIHSIKVGEERLIEFGAKKIKTGSIVYTHCHSSTVVNILIKAKEQGKTFEVYNTETRPRFQGRITATDLAKAKIPVTHFVDSAAAIALSKADLFLMGADAITSEGNVFNKVGSGMIATLAHALRVPVYSCTHSWKFDPLTVFGSDETVELRDPKEIWSAPPKGVKVLNPAFEIVLPELVAGVITELGVFRSDSLIEELRREYPFLF
ncbi:translation initiation factor eIF-2B [Candidatus Woesearchaeota archaeon]|jgi:ribose 1,5-bisphosphate isomerase|nr:translation initiation factor eIF-2B [Candidatus Woesearchaeota archaeon]